MFIIFFFKQKTAYEMRISDWSSDVCSSDLNGKGGEIFAIVCLVRWNPRAKDGYIFGYKDMDETMGPCEADCPARILDLLTPTDKEYAREWRARCCANLERRARQLADGDRIRLPEPMTFSEIGRAHV